MVTIVTLLELISHLSTQYADTVAYSFKTIVL
jgi:hypothetical protein